ncbi:hypothetical protein EDB19DRAFT_2022777 [Suillus lakei]|nr:hypothetical protein EDB19DRAFT_2022777 [Suillus lakei]
MSPHGQSIPTGARSINSQPLLTKRDIKNEIGGANTTLLRSNASGGRITIPRHGVIGKKQRLEHRFQYNRSFILRQRKAVIESATRKFLEKSQKGTPWDTLARYKVLYLRLYSWLTNRSIMAAVIEQPEDAFGTVMDATVRISHRVPGRSDSLRNQRHSGMNPRFIDNVDHSTSNVVGVETKAIANTGRNNCKTTCTNDSEEKTVPAGERNGPGEFLGSDTNAMLWTVERMYT